MVLAHNLLAMNAQRQYNITGMNKKKSTEKLSSGYRINRAADDAAGLHISEKMRRQIRGLDRGTENMEDGVSWLQIGDGAMAEVQSILQRMTELSVHGANGTLSETDRQAIDAEMQQLKVELNRINETTKFNDIRIFSNDSQPLDDTGAAVIKKLEGVPDDLSIFNATYDEKNGVTYGGILFNGERIAWDKIYPDMVYKDGNRQRFHEGTWVHMDDENHMLTISAKEGDEVPRITRIFDITADREGLQIDGETIAWKDIKNQSGQSVADTDYFNDKWTANYHGAALTFEVKNSYRGLDGMIDAINEGHDSNRYHVYAVYSGSSEVQAVDADIAISNLCLSDDAAEMIAAGKSYVIGAGTDGIWLQDSDGNMITDSKRTWSDMGIKSWNEGDDIHSDIQYEYQYQYPDTDGDNDINVSFTFTLSDITSVDSVIAGLDGVELNVNNIKNNYQTEVIKNPDITNVKDIVLSGKPNLSVKDEVDLGRDFNDSTHPLGVGELAFDDQTKSVNLSYADSSGNEVITYTGQITALETKMGNDLKNYEDSFIATKIMQVLAGVSDRLDLGPKDLKDLLGEDHITTSGELSDTVTITDQIKTSDANGRTSYQLTEGKTYACGKIDFSGLNTEEEIWKLVGSGFDSTCATCSKHYSFKFVFDVQEGGETNDRIRYRADKSNYNNPVLEISVSSLIEKNKTGKDLAFAITDIADAVFDDHFQQYAADKDGVLYIVEPRPESNWAYTPSFYTEPYKTENQNSYTLNLTSDSNGSQNLTYTYDYADYRNQIKVEMMKDDSGGQYVKKDNGIGYELYDPKVHTDSSVPRYNIRVSYADTADGSPDSSMTGTKTVSVGGTDITVNSLGNADSARSAYINQAVTNMTKAASVSLSAMDFTTVDITGDENPNVAVDTLFEAYSVEMPAPPARNGYIKGDASIQIQKSGDVPNKLMIPRFSLNAAVLGLGRANCLTEGACRNAIGMVSRALENVSTRRSLYGALQNRLEHAIRSNENTEENTTAAESRIRDTDMAEEMVSYAKHNILEQAGQSMLSQANLSQQSVLSLLQ